MADATEPGADPGDARAAIERYRDLAKYLITVFAAVGGLGATENTDGYQ